ncbi:aldehyde dehydrogenase family protein [Speluncibacter jeojiensis]|uniref:Aldehyde dehydrogenase family protein n=1 Tax=Speluncibacter jeojiensis TaxID=2710754 RepID=A0A9X4M536_9ACTN|nr:aldehyde dehydrogenase family protein [Corynebacteriales bacterium D3-21]
MTVTDLEISVVAATVAAARRAGARTRHWDQIHTDEIVRAVGWELYREDRVRTMARRSLECTGLGTVDDLVTLHRKRVLGTLRDLHGRRTVGVIEDKPELGTRTLAKPLGVVAVVAPATAPCATIATNTLSLLKTRNAVVISAHPSAYEAVAEAVAAVHDGLRRVGGDESLVQLLERSDRADSEELMAAADFVVATGGPGTVRRAYRSGTPAVGAGTGNSTFLVDELADLGVAAGTMCAGAGFNNGTSCSSESNALVDARSLRRFLEELTLRGGRVCTAEESARLERVLWTPDGRLDRTAVGRTAAELARRSGIDVSAGAGVRTLVIVRPEPRPGERAFTEKLAPVLTVAPYRGFGGAVDALVSILRVSGIGHSCGIHTGVGPVAEQRISDLADAVPTCRVMVNQSTMGNAGSFDNGLPFTSVVASGSWGGCSQSENITWRHFLNRTTISRPTPERIPDEREIFGGFVVEPEPEQTEPDGGDPRSIGEGIATPSC